MVKKLFVVFLSFVLCTTNVSLEVLAQSSKNGESVVDGFAYTIRENEAVITKYTGDSIFVKIPDTIEDCDVTTIESNIFEDGSNILGVEIPENVTTIKANAFDTCSNVEYISLPKSLATIEYNGLNVNADCEMIVVNQSYADTYVGDRGLKRIKRQVKDIVSKSGTSGEVSYLHNLITKTFYVYGNGEMDDYGGNNQPWHDDRSKIEKLKILDGVTKIGDFAFSDHFNITGILTIPDTVTSIGVCAFCDDTKVTEINLSHNLKNLYSSAFLNCYNIQGEVVIPDGVQKIYDSTFNGCEKISRLVIGSSVQTIGNSDSEEDMPFYGMEGVKEVVFKGSNVLTCAYQDLFSSMNDLETIYVPSDSYNIYADQFKAYINNAQIKVSEFDDDFVIVDHKLLSYQGSDQNVVIPDGIQIIETSAFQNNKTIQSVVFNSGLKEVGAYAFNGCSALITVTLNDELETIGDYSFKDCELLKMFDLKNTKKIGSYAFQNCKGFRGQLILPNSVTTIGEGAFKNCRQFSSLVLSDAMKSIPDHAFDSCISMGTVNLKNITSIGNSAFYNCSNLSGTLIIPSTVTSIGESAFDSCGYFTGLKLSENLTQISKRAFYGCDDIQGEIVIPESVEIIQDSAFTSCNKVTSLVIGSNVTTIGTGINSSNSPFYAMSGVKVVTFKGTQLPKCGYNDIFYSMNALEKVYVPLESYQAYTNQFKTCINNGKIVTDLTDEFVVKNDILLHYNGESTNVIIPDGIKSIGSSAFQNNTTIESVEFNHELIEVGDYAFNGCSALTNVTINDALETIGDYSFQNCKVLNLFDLKNVNTIGDYAFNSCIGFTGDLILPNSITSIGRNAFAFCKNLTSLTLSDAMTSIPRAAFYFCSKLSSVDLKNVTSIGQEAFENCLSLTGILNIPSTVTRIESRAFFGCKLLYGPLVIPDSVTYLGDHAFYICEGLNELILSQNLTSIPYNCFYGCESLQGDIIIPDRVESIGNHAFKNCNQVTRLVIGSNVNKIGTGSYIPFDQMSGVKEIVFKGTSVPTCRNNDLFNSMDQLETIYVPSSAYEAYANQFAPYINHAKFKISDVDDEFVIADDKLLLYQGNDINVVIPDGVQEISSSAFQNNKTIESVTFNNELKKVGAYAFNGCSALTSITVNDALETIGDHAFQNCILMNQFDFKNIIKIGNYAFENCTGLNVELVLPNSITSIGESAFANCTNVTSLDLKNIISIGNEAFSNCSALSGTLTIPNSVTTLGDYAFSGCSNISGLKLSENLTDIPSYAFNNCSNIQGEIVIPESVQTIQNCAFNNCSKVTSIVVGSNVTTLGTGINYDELPFYGMSGIKDITFKCLNKPSYQGNIVYSMEDLETIYVPLHAYEVYMNAFKSIQIYDAQIKPYDCEDDFVIIDHKLLSYQGTSKDIIIPEGVEVIGSTAFQNNGIIENVTFNSELREVEDYAFEGCSELRNVTINDKLEIIGNHSFDSCKLLNLFDLKNVITIGDWAFYGCSGMIGELVLPNSVMSIGSSAFFYCEKLTGIVLSDAMTSIPDNAFNSCTNATSVDLKNVTSIGAYAFICCSSLTGTLKIPSTVTRIGNYAFYGCSGLTGSLIIPDSITSIGVQAFYSCTGITGLKLSENITSIPDECFSYCESLQGDIIIPDRVETIGDSAFDKCNKITSLVIGSNVHQIGSTNDVACIPFVQMFGVKEVMFKGMNVPTCAYDDLFFSIDNLEKIYVPTESYDAYVKKFDAYKNNAVFLTNPMEYSVQNLKASHIYSKSVDFTWSPHPNESVKSYVILRDGIKIGEANNCKFADYDLVTNQTYTYTVYGKTENDEETGRTSIEITPKPLEFINITTNHIENRISDQDGRIYINANNQLNDMNLEINQIKGMLYYIDSNGGRVLIGDGIATNGKKGFYFLVNWDVRNVEEGNYQLVFVYRDQDDYVVECNGEVNVDKTIPQKIENFVAVGDLDGIHLSWSQSSEVDSTIYKIYRAVDGRSNYNLIRTINNRNTLTALDQSVDENKTYRYYIVCENSFGVRSERSDEAVAAKEIDTEAPLITKMYPDAQTYIARKQNISVQAIDNMKPVSAKFYYSINDTNWELIGEDRSAPFQASFNTKTVRDGIVSVKAVVYDAKGNASEGKIVKYNIDNTGPEAIQNLRASTVLTTKITLRWDNVSDADVRRFVLEQKDRKGNFIVLNDRITSLGYNLDYLNPSTEYTYRVRGIDHLDNMGEYSQEFSVKTLEDTTAPTITRLSPSASRRNKEIYFQASAGDDYGIKSISIQVSKDKKSWMTISKGNYVNANKTATYGYSLNIDGYEDGSLYVRAIATDFSNNTSDTSDAAAFVEYMIDRDAPDDPRDLLAAGGDGYIYLSWLQGDEQDLGTYSIYRSTNEKNGFIQLASNVNKVNYYDTSAKRDTKYYYKIAVRDTLGNISGFSKVVSAKVADDISAPEVVSLAPTNGSKIGKNYYTIEALIKDNNCLSHAIFEYKINDASKYILLNEIKNIGNYYATVRCNLPIQKFKDGDIIHVRAKCSDITGLTSQYSHDYIYHMDMVAPTLNNFNVNIDEDVVTLSWNKSNDQDLSGYYIYRVGEDGGETFIGSRGSGYSTYRFVDYLRYVGEGSYSYKIVAYDRVGNQSTRLSDVVQYEIEEPVYENQAPIAKISGMETMEIDNEQYFDASASQDDSSIVDYVWDFGDGTSKSGIRVIKKFKQAGTFRVALTVTDEFGLKGTTTFTVNVKEKTSVGTIRVKVVDENGNKMANTPVYYALGSDDQKIIYTDGSGYASYMMNKGEYSIGSYKSGYLPFTKKVKVLPNATRDVTLTLIKQDIIAGEFEVTRMTFSEIKEAGIDIYDPANQNVYTVQVTLKYGKTEIPVKYIRNDSKILEYKIIDIGGKEISSSDEIDPIVNNNRVIKDISYVPNKENKEIIAVLDMNASASVLKEFFDVKLHLINQATKDFVLKDNQIDLRVPKGLTLMQGVMGDWYNSTHVSFDSLRGQEKKTISWILRGDEIGTYDLRADYHATLDQFNEPVQATFTSEDAIQVYGLQNFKFDIQVNKEIEYDAFYFNIGIKNTGTIDYYCPQLDFDGIVSNITSSTKLKQEKKDISKNSDFEIKSDLLNVRYVTSDGKSKYVDYGRNKNGSIKVDIDTLAPGESIYYEYVAYNMIDYSGIAYFNDAVSEELEGIGGGVTITPIDMNLYAAKDAIEKVELMKKATSKDSKSLNYLLDGSNYFSVCNSDQAFGLGAGVYDSLRLVLKLDFDTITQDDKKYVIKKTLVEMMSDENLYDDIEDKIDTQYLNAAKHALDFIESAASRYEFTDETQKEKVLTVINDAFSNKKTMNKLAQDVKKFTGAELEKAFYVDLGISVTGGLTLTAFKGLTTKILEHKKGSPLMDGLAGVGKYGGLILDYGLIKPIELMNKAIANEYLYDQLQMVACKEECMLLLNSMIEFYTDDERIVNLLSKLHFGFVNPLQQNSSLELKRLICKEAMILKKTIMENYSAKAFEICDMMTQYVVGNLGEFTIKESLKESLGKKFVIYKLIGAGFETVDGLFKLEEKYKAADTYAITAYIGLAVANGFGVLDSNYDNPDNYDAVKNSGLFKDVLDEDDVLTQEQYANYMMCELEYLTKVRLLGEKAFKDFVTSDNTTILDSDAEYDSKIVQQINQKMGTENKTIDACFDTLFTKILKARDQLFQIESTQELEKPAAPKVSINYETLKTNQTFDDSYEYCGNDGIWHSCTNEPIKVYPKTTPGVLRVRVKSQFGDPSGEITSVPIYTRKELSKTISVRYDNGIYKFTGLNEYYTYQAIDVENMNGKANWESAIMINGGYNVLIHDLDESEYIAIRSMQNDANYEMTSAPLILKVSSKKPLTCDVEGDGSIIQPASDGMYFVGEDIHLIADPKIKDTFDGWYINGEKVSSDLEYDLEMYENADIKAKFNMQENILPNNISIVLPQQKQQSLLHFVTSSLSNVLAIDDMTRDLYMFKGDNQKLTVTISPSNATDKNVTWTSQDPDIIEVSVDGVVKAKNVGVATITAQTSNGISSDYVIEVTQNHITSLEVTHMPSITSYFEGDVLDKDGLEVVATYADGSQKYISDYTISDLESHEIGTKTITISKDDISTTFEVNVVHDCEWQVKNESTCANTGIEEWTCRKCKEVINTRELPLKQHAYEWIYNLDETDNVISKTSTCKVCKHEDETIMIQAHQHDYKVDEHKPDCIHDGYITYSCNICGYSYTEKPHYEEIEHTEIVPSNLYPQSPHSYQNNMNQLYELKYENAVSLALTFSSETNFESNYDYLTILDAKDNQIGKYTGTSLANQTITVNGDYVKLQLTSDSSNTYYGFSLTQVSAIMPTTIFNENLSALGHDYEETIIEPTCYTKGYTLHTCSRCDDRYIDQYVDKTQHEYQTRTIEATCEKQGYTETYCLHCDDSTKSDFIEKLPHTFVAKSVNASCTHGGGVEYECDDCGYQYIADETQTLEHNYQTLIIEPTCTSNGYTLHTCSECGDTYKSDEKPMLDHQFGEWMIKVASSQETKGIQYRVCALCNEEETRMIDKVDHIHKGTTWQLIKEPKCDQYGVEGILCSECNEMIQTRSIDPLQHEYETSVVAPDCDQKGYTLHTCTRCSDTYKTDEVDALQHELNDWTIMQEPTCLGYGHKVRTCKNCERVIEQEKVVALGHNVIVDEGIEATCTQSGLTQGSHCDRCDTILEVQETIEDLGHNVIVDEGIDATCTQSGLTQGSHCDRCDTILGAQETIEALGHTYDEGIITQQPQGTTVGIKKYTCIRGDDSYLEVLTPGQVQNVHANALNLHSIELKWDSVDGANYYDIYMEKDNEIQNIKRVQGSETSTQINDLIAGKSYIFKVKAIAIDEVGTKEGSYSEGVSISTTIMETPNITVSENDYRSVNIEWDAIQEASGYEIYQASDLNGEYKLVKTLKETSACISKLQTGKDYYFMVRAYYEDENQILYSAFSEKKGFVPEMKTAPILKSVEKKTYGTLQVTWKGVSGASYYVLERREGTNGKWKQLKTFKKNVRTAESRSLKTGTEYYYRIRARRYSGDDKVFSPYSEIKSNIPTMKTTKVSVVKKTSSSAKVSWKTVSGADGYEIYQAIGKGKYTKIKTVSLKTKSLIVKSLKKKTTYKFKVRAYRMISKKKVYNSYSSAISYKA